MKKQRGERVKQMVDRAISSVTSKPASESSVPVSGLSRVHGLRVTAKMKPVTAFNPQEKVAIGNESLSLAQYAARMNIQLLKAADLNEMFHTRGVEKRVTVQKVCTRARNETEVREALAEIWDKPTISLELIAQMAIKNEALFEFEKALEQGENLVPQVAMTIRSKSTSYSESRIPRK